MFHCPDDAGVGTMAASYALNANFGVASTVPGYPEGTAGALTNAQFNSPSRTVMLFEVANSTYYDITNETRTNINGYNADNMYNGGSASGYGYGGDYDPNGNNSQQAATALASGMKLATGWIRYSCPTGGGPTGNFTAQAGRHTNGANYLMADTHAKFFQPNAVTSGFSVQNSDLTYCGGIYSSGATGGSTAAGTGCSDSTIGATFSVL